MAATKPRTKAAAAKDDLPDDMPAQTPSDPQDSGDGGEVQVLRVKDLVERAALRSGQRKNVVKPTLEAALAVLGEALDAGETLIIPPLGKIKVIRKQDTAGGATQLRLQLRRPKAVAAVAPLAEVDGEG
ncbi:MAG: hypothetical protein GC146_14465 [Limimaricola sp.]|uniref:hypothetical protein n=1 Tax=Limimaricola sp. TaxID=2211665 RepID=UPI001E146B53|nr:hypothetical protein [Limimaricola sp.]MBI1418418.1 hypothetical protein [Limimaricola sp.]